MLRHALASSFFNLKQRKVASLFPDSLLFLSLYDKNSRAALCAPYIAKEERRSSVLSGAETPRDATLVWLVIVNWGEKREIQFDVWMLAFSLFTSFHWPVNVNIGWQPLSRSELLFLSVDLQFHFYSLLFFFILIPSSVWKGQCYRLCCSGCFSSEKHWILQWITAPMMMITAPMMLVLCHVFFCWCSTFKILVFYLSERATENPV